MKKFIHFIFVFGFQLLIAQNFTGTTPGQPTGSSQEVGITEGQLSVSLTGGANYQLPILVPPGINGVVPQVALNYNSHGGNGSAGYGWNITGISSITRIPSTKYHDGIIDGVDNDTYDRFALDGQRLILKSGTYGAHNAVYETENYSNIKVISYGGSGTNPSYFKVFYPDGNYALFGSDSYSKTLNQWNIKRLVTPQDLRISYSYIKQYNTLYISSIRYGSKGTDYGINNISFIYGTRNRPEQAYIHGYSYRVLKRLKEIRITSSSTGYRNYILGYNTTSLGYDRLISVTEKSGDNTKSLNPTIFNYVDTANEDLFERTESRSGLTNTDFTNTGSVTGDFNGDGKMDAILYPKTGTSAKKKYWILTDIDKGGTNYPREVNSGSFEDILPVTWLNHFNKLMPYKGWTVVKKTNSQYKFPVYSRGITNTTYFQGEKVWNAPTYSSRSWCNSSSVTRVEPQKFLSGDFNGDGISDIIAIGRPYSYQYCETAPCEDGGPLDTPFKSGESKKEPHEDSNEKRNPILIDKCCNCETYYRNTSKVHFIDLDRRKTSNYTNLAGYLSSTLPSSAKDSDIQVGDFNGDGKSDFFVIQKSKITVYSLNNNNSLVVLATVSNDNDIKEDLPHLLGDYNGDGKSDILVPKQHEQDSWAFYFSKGNGFYKKSTTLGFNYYNPRGVYCTYNDYCLEEVNYIPVDINGDGKTDIITQLNYTNAYNGNPIRMTLGMAENISVGPDYINFNLDAPEYVIDEFGPDPSLGVGKHPLPLFLTGNDINQNLEYAVLSKDKLYHFKHTKNSRVDVQLREIVTGNGVVETINYSPLISGEAEPGAQIALYRTSNSNAIYPNVNIDVAPQFQVVSKLEKSSKDQYAKQLYSYYGAVSNVEGLGFLGFESVLRTNWHNDDYGPMSNVTKHDISKRGVPIESYTSLGLQYNFQNTPSSYTTKTVNSYSSTISSKKVFKLKLNSSASYDGLHGTSIYTTINYDAYNNPLSTTRISKEVTATQETETTTLTYQNNTNGGSSLTNPYYVGRVKSRDVQTIAGGDTYSAREEFLYNTTMFVLQKKTKGHNTAYITETFVPDAFGNIKSKTISGSGEASRITSYEYETSGRYIKKSTDIEGLITNLEYNTFGHLLKETSPYGNITRYEYDAFGRKVKKIDYLGNQTTYSYSKPLSVYTQAQINYPDGSKTLKRFDDLGREILSGSFGFRNAWDYVSTEYDIYDKNVKVSEPHSGYPSLFNTLEYDIYGRLVQTRTSAGQITSISYNGLTTTSNDGYKNSVERKNSIGQVVSVTDNGGTVSYQYAANGNLKRTSLDGIVTSITHDGWGRKIQLNDPSSGVYSYEYNSYGELKKETTPKGVTTYTLDGFGKVTEKRVQGDYTNLISYYSYNSSTKLLTGIATNLNTSYQYEYDGYMRLKLTRESNISAIFEHHTTYDGLGRSNTERYLGRNLSDNKTSDITIKNTYKNGELHKILNNSNQSVLWQLNVRNQRGQVTNAVFGNGINEITTYDSYGLPTRIRSVKNNSNLIDLRYTFDARRGNLTNRTSSIFGSTERFQYDNLNRLTEFTNISGYQEVQNYDGKGRITSNALGTFDYSSGSKAYQNASIDLSNYGQNYYATNPKQNILYNAFKAPYSIEVGSNTHQEDQILFQYNIFNQRSFMNYELNRDPGIKGQPYRLHNKAKIYAQNGAIEIKRDLKYNKTEFTTYIGGNAYSAPLIYRSDSSGNKFYYLHRDYLGSIIAISDQQGAIQEKRHFDAWGKLAFVKNGQNVSLDKLTILDRGYTGHEHLESVDLIHMNARLYDANLHRFLAPDNFVQAPFGTQSLNRYSYVLNNPLIFVDHNGEFWHIVIGAVIGGVVNLAVKAAQGKINSFGDGLAAFGIGAVAGGVGAAVGLPAFLGAGGGASGAGGFLAGFAGGAASAAVSAPILSAGNSAYFGDPLMTPGEYLQSIALGGLIGGTINGGIAKFNGRRFFDGALPRPEATAIQAPRVTSNDIKEFNKSYQDPKELKVPDRLYHYTDKDPSEWTHLGRLDDELRYLTNDPDLNAFNSKLNLSLDGNKTPNFRIEFKTNNLNGFDPSKVEIIRRVNGNVFGKPGGGWEVLYRGKLPIDPNNIKVIPID